MIFQIYGQANQIEKREPTKKILLRPSNKIPVTFLARLLDLSTKISDLKTKRSRDNFIHVQAKDRGKQIVEIINNQIQLKQ